MLLIDEPTATLNPDSQGEVIRFQITRRNSGRTIVTATHDLDIIEDIADYDYAYVLSEGKVVGQGKPAEILPNDETHLVHKHGHFHENGVPHRHAHSHRQNHEHAVISGQRYRPLKNQKSFG